MAAPTPPRAPRQVRLLRRPGSRGPSRRGLRLPEYLACVGIAVAGWWPGDHLSSTHLILVTLCLVPLAVRTLLRWEEFTTPPYGLPATTTATSSASASARSSASAARTGAGGGREDDVPDHYRSSFERALVALAILEVDEAAVHVRQCNRTLRELIGDVDEGTAFTALVTPRDRVLAHTAALALGEGRLEAWRGVLSFLPVATRLPAATGLPTAAGLPAAADTRAPHLGADAVAEPEPVWLQVNLVALPSRPDGPRRISLQAVDVTAQRREEQRLRDLALRDTLTGLPNRTLLLDRLGVALAGAHRGQGDVAVLFCDLDDFKAVNDAHGHAAGDALLREAAARLAAAVRPADTVARFGGDEFVVLCPNVPDETVARSIATRVEESLLAPLQVGGDEVHVRISVGLALSRPGATADDLLAEADRAMYAVKRAVHGITTRRRPRDEDLAPTG